MGRILGKVEDGVEAPKYFIHCDTAGSSFGPLFAAHEAAWAAYDKDELDGLYAASPALSQELRVIRKSLAHGREFAPNGETYGEPLFGLATADRLLSPRSRYDDDDLSFMRFDGVLHLATNNGYGFGGSYDVPLCDEGRSFNKSDEHLALEDFFGKSLVLCPHCVAKITEQ